MEDVTCGVKTLMRPACLNRLLKSVYAYYPTMKMVIVDDSKDASLSELDLQFYPHVKYIRAPYDTGLGACRNIMVDAIETKYTVYLDDDFVFIAETQLEKFHAVLAAGKADLVGGQYKEKGSFRLYHGLFHRENGLLTYVRANRGEAAVPFGQLDEVRFKYVDVVNNFFMARTDLLQEVRWDGELKINTHTEFFLRASEQMRIAYCPEVHVYHRQVRNREYSKLRFRRYREIALRKHGIHHVKFEGKWG